MLAVINFIFDSILVFVKHPLHKLVSDLQIKTKPK